MVTEEGLVKRGNGGGGVAHTLHPNRRKVDIEVATKAGDRFGILRVEVGVFVGADANEASLVTCNDSAVPAERPAKWADWVGKNFTGVGPGVMRKSLACWPVGNPSILHIRPSYS